MKHQKYHHPKPFVLECGDEVQDLTLDYSTYGTYESGKKVVWICHALTANSDVQDWWPNTVGEGLLFDPNDYFIICANVIGSCYGSQFSSAKTIDVVTVKDMVAAHQLLAQHLGINEIELIVGGSLGGMQALEWCIKQPDFIKKAFIMAVNARASAWNIAFNEAQRMALDLGEEGIKVARAIAMLSYRNYEIFEHTQQDNDAKIDHYKASSYQNYQGLKFKNRFTHQAYRWLSKAMDSHHVGRGHESVEAALGKIKAKTMVSGILNDVLFPIHEQAYMAQHIPNCIYQAVDSRYGHDGFLIETEIITNLIKTNLLND
jgi:homoserine O-acetyltransferase/O-succinyltransferase